MKRFFFLAALVLAAGVAQAQAPATVRVDYQHGLVIETAPGEGTLITMRVPKSQPGHDA